MTEAARIYIQEFINNQDPNKEFNPPDNISLAMFQAEYYCGKFENTQAARLHFHCLIRLKNWTFFDDIRFSRGDDRMCRRLLEWINKWVGSFIRIFGQELDECIKKADLKPEDWDLSKPFNPKMVDTLNTDPYRWHQQKNSKYNSYKTLTMLHCILDNTRRQMKANQGLEKIPKNKKLGDDEIFETYLRFSEPNDIKKFSDNMEN